MNISTDINANLKHIKSAMSIPLSADAILREFAIIFKEKKYKAFLIYYEGMVTSQRIDDFIMQSLHLIPPKGDDDLKTTLEEQLLSLNQLKVTEDFSQVFNMVNYGGCAVFADTLPCAFLLDVKGWERRGVSQPVSENVIHGSQEGFTSTVRINTGMIRRLVRQENLICEGFQLGKQSKTPCNLMYIKGNTDSKIVSEIRRRLNAIEADNISSSGELEQLLEDFSFFPSPQIISTERPDRTATALMEGKAAILLDGTPYALIMPITAFDLLHTTEDRSLRFPYANLVRLVRIIALIISLLLPSVFVAMCNFHQETIPVHLLFAIAASRRSVPFTLMTELILFEIAFEIIREASIRIPSSAGSAMGIIGGLIIGQAAIEANIVSPIVIIIVALTGIGSFTIPNYSLTFAYRILKYLYILLGATSGFLGIALGLIIHLVMLCNSQSLGIPFLAPFSEFKTNTNGKFFVKPIWKRYSYKNPRKWAEGTNSTKTPVEKTQIE